MEAFSGDERRYLLLRVANTEGQFMATATVLAIILDTVSADLPELRGDLFGRLKAARTHFESTAREVQCLHPVAHPETTKAIAEGFDEIIGFCEQMLLRGPGAGPATP